MGLEKALDHFLKDNGQNANDLKITVLLTDGVDMNQGRFREACDATKSMGAIVYTVAFGPDVAHRQSVKDLMNDCATDSSKSIRALTATDLRNAFQTILEDTRKMKIVH